MRMMQRVLLCLAVVVVTVGQAEAAIVYSQPLATPSTSQFGANSDGPLSNSASTQQVADSFLLASAANIASVDWFGIYHDGDVPAAKNFLVRFFADAGSLPDALLFEETVSVAGVDTGLNNSSGSSIMEYSGSLNSPFAAAGGTSYFLSILENDPTTTSIWAWQLSDEIAGKGLVVRSLDADAWFVPITQDGPITLDMAYTLNSADVPVPASLVLWGMGGGLAFLGRKLRRGRKPELAA